MESNSKDPILPLNVEATHTKKKVLESNISCDGSVMIVSLVEEEKTEHKNNLLLGVSLMMLAIIFVTLGHVLIKYLTIASPYITPYDLTLFMGLFNCPLNFLIGIKSGINMNIFKYAKTVLFLFF